LWADAMVIAPCTASTIGKIANGIADNMLITTYLSMKAPVFIAPAMDLDMFAHQSTKNNLDRLRSYGNIIIEPQCGFLASGLEGKGRMEEPSRIVEIISDFFDGQLRDLVGKTVMITAGPTYEKIDPVRFIGNYSSGKMGFAIAEECSRRGADVVLISGPVSMNCSSKIQRINVNSSDEMYRCAVDEYEKCNVAILCAAVADFRPSEIATTKIKRGKDDLVIRLSPTKDIAAELGREKRQGQILIGFALETNNENANAKKKLQSKNFDFIVLNSTRNEGTTFQSDFNQISIISNNSVKSFEKKKKTEVAHDIVDELVRLL